MLIKFVELIERSSERGCIAVTVDTVEKLCDFIAVGIYRRSCFTYRDLAIKRTCIKRTISKYLL